jgi:hypothetical protein
MVYVMRLHMRPKFVATILIFVGLMVGAAIFFKSHMSKPALEPGQPTIAVNPQPSSPPPVVEPAPAPQPPPAPQIAMTAAERQAAAEAEIAKLQVWQRNDDSESYRNILKDLTYSEKEVRYAAMDALKQVDNTNAIPTLRELAAKTDDLDEAKALLDTAQFISLPPADLVGLGAKRSKSSSGAGANH